MAFTDHSDLFGSAHEAGLNRVVRHIMRQRPSLFHYATPMFHERPELLCEKIEAARSVTDAGNPLFTEVEPLPILASPLPIGLNWCLQITDAEVDFHPGSEFALPPELDSLLEQRFALRGRACAGVDCPSEKLVEELLPGIRRILLAQQELAVDEVKEGREEKLGGVSVVSPRTGLVDIPHDQIIPLPTRELICACLELYVVGRFEWGTVPGSQQDWLQPRVDAVEIVDLSPEGLEAGMECYLRTVLELGILPRLMVPMEKMILDLTALLEEQGLQIGQQVTLSPAAVPADVPNNPAVEDDRIKVFVNLNVS